MRVRPVFFDQVREEARRRWDQLEADPELAGPWRQLFAQVQSPKHVVSELLQNADDAEAKHVHISTQDGCFCFMHDGHDFTEEEFRSLCRFGFSNKRTLFTIGFRGVGFKSTFSLGDTVELLTPSLAVKFSNKRFTEPIWINDAPSTTQTTIRIPFKDKDVKKAVEDSLRSWIKSPVSLAFFRNIQQVVINGTELRRESLGEGPISFSEWIRLIAGETNFELLIIHSQPEPFPPEAIEELKAERNLLEDIQLPPAEIQLILGLPGDQKIYVILPTGASLDTPFSCNGPFIQDPARYGIKDPSRSPTNRWLLQRAGRLAAEVMYQWLLNDQLSLEERAQAYQLLPPKPDPENISSEDPTFIICQSFEDHLRGRPVILSHTGKLANPEEVSCPPSIAYRIWSEEELLEIFESPFVVSKFVSDEARQLLEEWEWLECWDEEVLVRALESDITIPRPSSYDQLLELWLLVYKLQDESWWIRSKVENLSIIPVKQENFLLPANSVVRLPEKNLSNAAIDLLKQWLASNLIDDEWITYIQKLCDKENIQGIHASNLLNHLNLTSSTNSDKIAYLLWSNCKDYIEDKEHVLIAHLFATLNASIPEDFCYVTRNGELCLPEKGLLAIHDPDFESLLPKEWADTHIIHDSYFCTTRYSICTSEQWKQWMLSSKSRLLPFPIFQVRQVFRERQKEHVLKLLQSRGYQQQPSFYKNLYEVIIEDYVFPEELFQFWNHKSQEIPDLWARITAALLSSPSHFLQSRIYTHLYQRKKYTSLKTLCSGVISKWLALLKERPSLYDTYGQPRIPAELYCRTPETEPLLDVEPFVDAKLDTEATRPLLNLLGVRSRPADVNSLIDRIHALSKAPNPVPLLSEIRKWYQALDRTLPQCDSTTFEELRQRFKQEPLILTEGNTWATSQEVFLSDPEHWLDPGLLVHPIARGLRIWIRLGVADQPTYEIVVDRLKNLVSNTCLDEQAKLRLHVVLAKYPENIWRETQHWLSASSSWVPINQLSFRLTKRSILNPEGLFPHIQAATADFRMLPVEVCNRSPFADLIDLDRYITYRLRKEPRCVSVQQKEWAIVFAYLLLSVLFEDKETRDDVRETAIRLAQSQWYIYDAEDDLQVVPYLEGSPAGPPLSRSVIWIEDRLYIPEKGPERLLDDVVNELSRYFNHDRVTEALKACYERPPDFIIGYMERHFEYDSATAFSPEKLQKDWQHLSLGQIINLKTDKQDNSTPKSYVVGASRKSLRDVLFRQFAIQLGYLHQGDRYVHPENGSFIERAEKPFHWNQYNSEGELEQQYWVSAEKHTTQVKHIPAEIWHALLEKPGKISIILPKTATEGIVLSGIELQQMKTHGTIDIYPAAYRIRIKT